MGNKRLSAFIAGGLIGAGIALLYAPRSGAETRAIVANRAQEAWGNAQEFGARAQLRGHELYEGAAARGHEIYEGASSKGQELYQGAAARVQEAAEVVRPVIAEKNAELREKIEAARQRIASQVVRNAEDATDHTPLAASEVTIETDGAVVADPATVANEAASAAQESKSES